MSVEKYYQQKIALGCPTTLVLVTDINKPEIDVLFAKLWLKIFKFEKRFSRFLKYSELSLFNGNAGNNTKISNEFENILIKAKQMAMLTENNYNPFVLPSLHKAGYIKSFIKEYKNDDLIDYSHRSVVSADNLIVANGYARIPANTAIDLGGIGKGYLADLLSESEDLINIQGYWFSFGGDVVGDGIDVNNEKWQINVQSATSPEKLIDYTFVPNKNKFAIATSGTITRNGVNSRNEKWHHIINPSNLKPSDSDVTLATVLAKNACIADVVAKTAVILGSRKSEKFLKNHDIDSYIIQKDSGNLKVIGDFINKPKEYSKNKRRYA